MAVAMDTPDFDGPHGSIHPRYKRQVADRLALAGLAVAYGDESEGLWQGPFPTGFRLIGPNMVVTLADGQVPLEARDTETSVHYEVCCSNDAAQTCKYQRDTNILLRSRRYISLQMLYFIAPLWIHLF